MKETVKTTCPSCEGQVSVQFDLPEEKTKIVREKCQCGMTSDYRSWRVGALVIISVVILGLGSCVALEWIEFQKIKLIDQSKFKIEQHMNGFDKKSYRVVPREDEKKEEKK